MNTVIFHFVGGDAFFSGFIAVAAGALLTSSTRRKRTRIGPVVVLFGWLLVIASATPLPGFLYVLAAVFTFLTLLSKLFESAAESKESEGEAAGHPQLRMVTFRWCWGLGVTVFGAMIYEFSMYHPTQIEIPTQLPVFVIGDSLSAGINDGVDVPWPTCLDELVSQDVSNHAQAGATCRSARKQLEGLPKQCVAIIEIGGNDLLSGRSSSDFRADLETLLTEVQSPDRNVVMFELPLPPLFNGYGYAQRELAAKHNVALIPRRVLASVLFSENATLDSIHLSNAGHQRLAERVAEILSLDMKQ